MRRKKDEQFSPISIPVPIEARVVCSVLRELEMNWVGDLNAEEKSVDAEPK